MKETRNLKIISTTFTMLMLFAYASGFAQHDSVVWIQNDVPLHLVLIEQGQFEMGSPEEEPSRDPDESPVHQVNISNSF